MTIDLSLGAHDWASVLLRVVVQGAVGFGLIWACNRAMPRMSPSIRCWLWWLGCAAMLTGFSVSNPVQMRLLPACAPHAARQLNLDASSAAVMPAYARRGPPQREVSIATSKPVDHQNWLLSIEAIWAVGVLLGALRMIYGLVGMSMVVRRSEPVEDARMPALLRDLGSRLGLRRQPDVRQAAKAAGPQVVWAWGRMVILLPPHVLRIEAAGELRLALAHELAHVQRYDLSFGWVPAMAEMIFWFDPLVRVAAREYQQAREEACDVDVLRVTQADPVSYARLLLQYGVRQTSFQLAASGAASSITALRRRLANLNQETQRVPPVTRIVLGFAAALACTLPCVRLVAQEPVPSASAPAPVLTPAPVPVAVSVPTPSPQTASPAAVVPDAPLSSPHPAVHPAPVAHQRHIKPLPPMPVDAAPASPLPDSAWRTEFDEAKRARTSITPQQLAELRMEADEVKRESQSITPQEQAAMQQAIAESRVEAMNARQEAMAAAAESQADALAQSTALRRQLASLRSQAFKRAMVGIDQAHLGKTLAEALKSVPGNIDTTEIERHVDAALKNLPKEMDGVDALHPGITTGKKIVIDHPGRYVIPQGSGVIINIPLHHVNIVGDTMTLD